MAQADLGSTLPRTMYERAQMANGMRARGLPEDQIARELGFTASRVQADLGTPMGRLGAGATIAHQGVQSAVEGVGGLLEDYVGIEGASEAADQFGEFVGPSEDRLEALAERQADQGIIGNSLDAIAGEAPALVGAIGAGAAAGSVVPGLGTVVGGVLGAGYGVVRMLDQGRDNIIKGKVAEALGKDPRDVTEEEIEANKAGIALTADEKGRVALGAATGVVDAFPAGRVLRAIAPGKVGAIAYKALGKKIATEAGKTALQEGALEVGQELAIMALTDPEVRAAIDELDDPGKMEIAKLIAETKGEELAVSFLAGVGLGGGAGAVAGGAQQSQANAQRKKEVAALTGTAQQVGVSPEQLNDLAKDPEKVPAIAEAAAEIDALNDKVSSARRVFEAAPAEEKEDAASVLESAESDLDVAVDRHMSALGLEHKSRQELRAEQRVEEDLLDSRRQQQAKDLGIEPQDGVDLSVHEGRIAEFDEQVSEIRSLQDRLKVATRPKTRQKLQGKIDEAIGRASKTRADIAKVVEGRDDTAAAKRDFVAAQEAETRGAQREAVVDRQYKRIQNSEDPVAHAARVLEGAAPDKSAQEKEVSRNISKLERRMDDVTTEAEADSIERQIEAERAKLTSDKPLVEAARRVLEDAGVDLEAEQSTEQQPSAAEPASQIGETASTEAADGAKTTGVAGSVSPSSPEAAGESPAAVNPAEEAARMEAVGVRDAAQAEYDAQVDKIAQAEIEGRPAQVVKTLRNKLERLRNDRDSAQRVIDSLGPEPEPEPEPDQERAGPVAPDRQSELDARYGNYQTVADIPAESPIRQSYEEDYVDLVDDFGKVRTTPAEAQRWLRDWTERTGYEATIAIDSDGRVLGAGTMNEANASPIPLAAMEAMSDPARQVRFLHSHPSETPLSGSDIRLLKRYPGMAVMEAVLPSGRVVRATPAERAIDLDQSTIIAIQLAALPEDADLSVVRSATIRQEAMLRALDDQGYITYNADRRLAGQKEINDATKRATDALTGNTDTGVGENAVSGGQQLADETSGPLAVQPQQPGGSGGDPSGGIRIVPEVAAGIDPFSAPKLQPMEPGSELRSVNPENVRAMALNMFNAIPEKGKSRLIQAKQAGEITPQSLANAVAVAADNDGQNAGVFLRNVAKYAYENPEGKTDQETYDMALAIINDASKVGAGKFSRTHDSFYDPAKRSNVRVSTISMDKDLRDTLGAEVEDAKFSAPMDDPNDVSGIKRGNSKILLDGPALARAERTARHLQAQKYVLDQDYISGMTADDLISSKALATVKNDKHLGFLRARAQVKLDRLKRMAEDWGDQELGFQYFIDRKGRMYPSGEFHHQSGDTIKAAFKIRTPDGDISLKDYNSIDHTGSGWQIAAVIARDDTLSPLVNLQPDTAGIPGSEGKGDIYTAVKDALSSRLTETFGPENAFVSKVINDPATDQPKSWNGKGGRNIMKTPVIAVNYAGEQSNFRTALLNTYHSDFKKGELPDGFWHAASDLAYEAVGDIAPQTKAFKDWAVAGLRQGIAAAEEKGIDLTITVGPDGKYSIRKMQPVSHEMISQDNRAGSPIKKIEAAWREDGDTVDVNKTARNIFSQIIQGYDAAIMHETVGKYIDATDGGPIVTNHDSYTVPPENGGILAAAVREAMQEVMGPIDVGANLRQEILDQTGVDIGEPPARGDYDMDSLDSASPVFVEENEVTGQPEERPPYQNLQGEDIARGIDFIASDTGETTGVRMDTSLPKAAQFAQDNQFRKGRDFKVALQEQALAAQEGEIDLRENTPEAAARLKDFLKEDARAAAVNNQGAIGWYDRKVTAAKNIFAEVYPEIQTDPEAEFKFIWALAVTSNGLKVDKNFELAGQAYDTMRETGKFPTKIGIGQAKAGINQGLAYYDTLVEKMGGWEPARDFMVARLPVRDIEKVSGIKVGKEGRGELLPGAAILGPKIGGGFFSNLYGNFDELTMDRWFTRTLGRWRGKLIDYRPDMEKAKREQMKEALRGLTAPELRELKKLFDGYDGPIRKTMTADQLDSFAVEVADRSASPEWRTQINGLRGGEDVRKIGNALAKYLDGQIEDPGGAADRKFIRDFFREGLAELRQTPEMSALTMADLQALLWYPEKLLYDTAKKKPGEEITGYDEDDAPDYENAARKFVDARKKVDGAGVARGRDIPSQADQREAGGSLVPEDGGSPEGLSVPEGGIEYGQGIETQEAALGDRLGPSGPAGRGDGGRSPEPSSGGAGPELARGIDIAPRVMDAPAKRGIAKPVEYKTPDRVARGLYQAAHDKGGTLDKLSQWIGRVGRGAARQIFDQKAGLKQIEALAGQADAGIHDGMSRFAQMMTANTGRVAAMMSFGAPKWNAGKKIYEIDRSTKGLDQIFNFNGVEDYQNFQGYAYAKRDRDLMAQGKGPRMTDDLRAEFEAVPDADKTRYDAMLADYKDYNNALRQLMLDSGLIDQKTKDALARENEYVPMYRVFDDPEYFGLGDVFGKNGFSHPDPNVRGMKVEARKVGEDGGGEFGDLIEGIHNNAVAVMHAASQNLAHKQIYDFMTSNLPNEVKGKVRAQRLTKKEKKAARRGDEQDAVKFYENGKDFYWRAKGEPEWTGALQLALAGLTPTQLDGIDRALKAFNSFQRTVITATPAFAIRSMIRDAGQAYVQSGTNPATVVGNNVTMLGESWNQYATSTQDMMMAAGVGGYQMQGMPDVDAANLRKKIGAQEAGRMHQIRQAFGQYERMIGATELAARGAVAEGQLQQTGDDASSAYEALNMIDYGRKGASRAVQRLSYMVLFLNPRLQGLYRLFETSAGDGPEKWAKVSKSLMARGLVLMGLGLGIRALTSMNDEDEERYRALSPADRATYYHIPVPGMDRFLRLPKPFEVGAAFVTLPVAGLDAVAMGPQGMNDLGQMAAHVFMETFSFNPTPQAVKPVVEVMLNKSMYNGREIEGMRLQGLPKDLRADLMTGGIAKALGNKVLSPVQIQHLLSGYLGPLGMLGVNSADAMMAGAGLTSRPAMADGVFGGIPSAAKVPADFAAKWMFSATAGERSEKYISDFYDLHAKMRQYTAAINEASRMGDLEEVQRLSDKSAKLMPLKPYFNKVSRALTKLNQQMRVAQSAPGLSEAERQRRIDLLNRKKNKVTRDAVVRAQNAGLTGSFLGGLIGEKVAGV